MELELYVPKREDLWFRREMLSDPATMSYNRGYQLDDPGYHNDTGCIDFPPERWDAWYARWIGREPERFYAYLRRREDGRFLGEVDLRQSGDPGWYEMGIVIQAGFRGAGWSAPGMALLLEYGFCSLGAAGISNTFEETRTAAWKLHAVAGFEPVGREGDAVLLRLTRKRYEKGRVEHGC